MLLVASTIFCDTLKQIGPLLLLDQLMLQGIQSPRAIGTTS